MIVSIGGKVRDMGYIILSQDDETYAFRECDYMPYISFLCGGDDIDIRIDNETGKIIGWRPLELEDFEDEE